MNRISKHVAVALGCLATMVSCSTHNKVYYGPNGVNSSMHYLSTAREYSSHGSVRPISYAELNGCPTGASRVTGTSKGFAFTGYETLLCYIECLPSLKEAYEDALNNTPGAIALKNVEVKIHQTAHWYTLLLLHGLFTNKLEVTGTPVYGK